MSTEAIEKAVRPEMFQTRYSGVFDSNKRWNEIDVTGSDLYRWDDESTYIQEPPFWST